MSSHEETKVIKKDEREQWLDSRLLKTAGAIIVLLSPLFAWIVLEIFSLKTEMAVQKEKIGTLLEIKQDIITIKNDVQQMKIDINTLKIKAGVQ